MATIPSSEPLAVRSHEKASVTLQPVSSIRPLVVALGVAAFLAPAAIASQASPNNSSEVSAKATHVTAVSTQTVVGPLSRFGTVAAYHGNYPNRQL